MSSLVLLADTFTGSQPPIRPVLVVDPNTCPAEVLEALPRVGPVLATRIVAERERTPFRSVEEIGTRVRGVGPVTVAAIRPFLRVASNEMRGIGQASSAVVSRRTTRSQ